MQVRRPDGVLTLVSGQSRSGKTAQTILETDSKIPLLVWDPEGQWSAMQRARSVSRSELLDLTIKGLFGRVSYTAPISLKEFDWFCTVAFAWARLIVCTVVVEELADVTHPGKAPPAWGTLLRRGLKYGCNIYGITQSPSESDKTIVRNAGRKLCFSLERPEDRAYMASMMDVPLQAISGLQKLEYLEKIRGAGIAKRRIDSASLRKLGTKPAIVLP